MNCDLISHLSSSSSRYSSILRAQHQQIDSPIPPHKTPLYSSSKYYTPNTMPSPPDENPHSFGRRVSVHRPLSDRKEAADDVRKRSNKRTTKQGLETADFRREGSFVLSSSFQLQIRRCYKRGSKKADDVIWRNVELKFRPKRKTDWWRGRRVGSILAGDPTLNSSFNATSQLRLQHVWESSILIVQMRV